jgi:hypothetical protein
VRAATLLTRPDGGHSEVLITRAHGEPAPDRATLRALERRIYKHGGDGHVRTDVSELPDALLRALLTAEPSLVIVDEPAFDASPVHVPLLVIDPAGATRVIADGDQGNSVAAEIARRLAK